MVRQSTVIDIGLMPFLGVLFPAFHELGACQHFCKVPRFNVLVPGPGGVFNIKMMHQDWNQSLLLSGSRYQRVNMRGDGGPDCEQQQQ